MKWLVFISVFCAFQTRADHHTTAPKVEATPTGADTVVNEATTEVKKAGTFVKEGLNKAAGKIQKKLHKEPPPAPKSSTSTK